MTSFTGHLRGSEGELRQVGRDIDYRFRLVREGRELTAYVGQHLGYRGEMIPAGTGFTCDLHDLVIRGDLFRVTGTRGADGYDLSVEVVVHEDRRFPWEKVA